MWNPIDAQLSEWLTHRSRILRHHLTPEGTAITELRASGVRESSIEALYPSRLTAWKVGPQAIIEQATSKPFIDFDFNRPVQQHAFMLMQGNYACARELVVSLETKSSQPELHAAWSKLAKISSDDRTGKGELLSTGFALVGMLAHVLATQPFAPADTLWRPEQRWAINFPSYRIVVDDLCSLLEESGWTCPETAPKSVPAVNSSF